MSGFTGRGFLRFVLLAATFLVIPAFGQFEIAPDHFDGEQHSAKQKSNLKPKAKPARQAAAAAAHPTSPPATATTVGNSSRRAQQHIARQSKPGVELVASRR